MKATNSGHALINGEPPSSSRRDEKDPAKKRPVDPAPVAPTPTPTPPLLTPGTFEVRDSAYSSATRWTREYPWVGREHDQYFLSEHGHARRDDPDPKHLLHLSAGKNDMVPRSSGPIPQQQQPSSSHWERGNKRDDVAREVVPPTIRENLGLEGNGHVHAQHTHSMDKISQPDRRRAGEARGKSPELGQGQDKGHGEGATTGTANGHGRHHHEKSPSERTPTPEKAVHAPKSQAARRETAMSGWVMVNVEPQDKKKASSHSPSPTRPSVRQRRSNSDSRILRTDTRSPVGQAPAPATMSAAAKTIAMIDAVDARERGNEKSSVGGLKRIFHRSKGLDGKKSTPEGGVTKNRSLDQEEKSKTRGPTPQAVKLNDKRIVLD
ncbi:uncharacterized protein PHACADRAFT_168324 [Phanerochaete carnosa HHB-10118-sp]|uniref:Uncharacterized protein n=1 Tax=Phanerochaete carnosa (strain HHB-10118-sp) TaxID=650164 RepID=K5WP31_PHACS|nr:uncharacterized protein PHACADRAFT_168324 [Phanerochaete carnosa HHB-10118-sp]EKM60974.1 hypothetical protein PHACADRAFT_168324 [Phanerochaete carnosa HHB-10118-sp]